MKYQLNDICEFINGGAWSDKEYSTEGIPVLKVSNIKSDGFSLDCLNYIPYKAVKKYKRHILKVGDVIIATVGSHPNLVDSAAGRSCVINHRVNGYLLNQNAVCVRTKNPQILSQAYLGYLCQTREFIHFIQMRGKGAANQMRIAISAIKSYKCEIPTLTIQNLICSMLCSFDSLIENNQKQIKLLEEAAQRLYKEWFVDLRFPGHETTPIVDGVPEGWTEKRFYELFSFVRGKSYTSKELSDADGILMVNLKSIRPFGGFRRNQEKHYVGKYNADQILEPGDIVMGVTDMTKERRLVGHVALVPDLQEKATFSMDLIKITPFSLPKSYLYSVLHFGGLSAQISQLANGVNVLHLKPEAMMNISMLCPDDSIIAEYDKLFSTIQNRIEILQSECDLAVEARDRLLPKLMNGEIEV